MNLSFRIDNTHFLTNRRTQHAIVNDISCSGESLSKINWEKGRLLFQVLAQMGYEGSYSSLENKRLDFLMSHDVGGTTRLKVIIVSRRMVNASLLPNLCAFLRASAPEFNVWLSCEFDDDDFELFFVEVSVTEAIGMFETVETAQAFGFEVSRDDIGPISLEMWS